MGVCGIVSSTNLKKSSIILPDCDIVVLFSITWHVCLLIDVPLYIALFFIHFGTPLGNFDTTSFTLLIISNCSFISL